MEYLFGLIGNPVEHSLSPWIHQQFFKQVELSGIYRKILVKPDDFATAMKGLKAINIDGFNVTVPYKQTIIPYLDDIDAYAEKIGAVNTVVNQDGKWKGFNTDGLGYIQSLKAKSPHLFQSSNQIKVLLIGAGGAARGIYRALVEAGFIHIDIANRTVSKAEALLELADSDTQTTIRSVKEIKKVSKDYQLIIQTTSVGMEPNSKDNPIEFQDLTKHTVVSDIVYKPIKTTFLKHAEELGAQLHFGHGMLLNQAALAFELWTSKKVEAALLIHPLEKRLRGD